MASAPGAGPTGNPVFDYAARGRRAAALIQRVLLWLGLVLLFLGGGAWLLTPDGQPVSAAALWEGWLGLALLGLSLSWGYAWRGWLRRSFRKKYGPQV